jgi:hypothetical protein
MRRGLLCLWLLACSGDDTATPRAWTLALVDHPAAMLSAWGSSATDVWVVGSRTELAGGPTIFHYDGTAWSQIDSEQASLDLWVVFGFDNGDVFFGGSGGTILRYRGGRIERMPDTPRMSGTIFGIWGPAPDDVWAVGTAVSAGAIVWHFDGTRWSEVAMPANPPNPVFKVAGRGAADVWMSAANGVVLRDDGVGVTLSSTGASGPLFSVAVTSSEVIAAGGESGNAQLVESTDGVTWTSVPLANQTRWRGLANGPDDLVYVVGEAGTVARKQRAAWELVPQAQTFVQRNFHAVWIDPDGGMWGVGGDFDRPDPKAGFILYYGSQALEEVVL